jgi:YegS/Rv2252/BmrU family lipid kinase
MNMDCRKWAFIINPVAGNGYAGAQTGKIKSLVKEYGLDAVVVHTQAKGHATDLAGEYARLGYKNIVAVGGDGTFNETLQALVHSEDVTFGAVSAGTGNDFIGLLGFSEHFTDLDWKVFFEGNTVNIDVGKCNKRYFLNGMGFGFDASVAVENYKDMQVKKGRKSKYLWQIIKTLLFYREKIMRIEVNGEKSEHRCFLTTIGNGRRFGGGFNLTPGAYANDGLFNICFVKQISLPMRIKELFSVIKGTHIYDKAVDYFQSESIRIETDEEVPIHLDGELLFGKLFEVSILPAKLKTFYNPHAKNYLI